MSTVQQVGKTLSLSPDGSLSVEVSKSGSVFRVTQAGVAKTRRGILLVAFMLPVLLSLWIGGIFPLSPLFEQHPVGFMMLGLLVTIIAGLAGLAWYYAAKDTPLIAEANGRVSYGEQVLLEPGALPKLFIERVTDPNDRDWFRVVSSNRWGPVVRFSVPDFDSFETREEAEWFARQLSQAIGAVIEES